MSSSSDQIFKNWKIDFYPPPPPPSGLKVRVKVRVKVRAVKVRAVKVRAVKVSVLVRVIDRTKDQKPESCDCNI